MPIFQRTEEQQNERKNERVGFLGFWAFRKYSCLVLVKNKASLAEGPVFFFISLQAAGIIILSIENVFWVNKANFVLHGLIEEKPNDQPYDESRCDY